MTDEKPRDRGAAEGEDGARSTATWAASGEEAAKLLNALNDWAKEAGSGQAQAAASAAAGHGGGHAQPSTSTSPPARPSASTARSAR